MTLATVEDTALSAATAGAEEIRRAARGRAQGIIDKARTEAAALIAQRRAAAERLAELEEQELLAGARGEARATVLGAQRSVLMQARAAAHAAAHQLAGDPRYEALLKRLAAEARERLWSTGLRVQLVSVAGGGFVARAGSREIDYSLATQVDRCLQGMAGELERLWR
jgi:vacuolar-type H+-ATPase subunit E/Vma4